MRKGKKMIEKDRENERMNVKGIRDVYPEKQNYIRHCHRLILTPVLPKCLMDSIFPCSVRIIHANILYTQERYVAGVNNNTFNHVIGIMKIILT